MGVDWGQPRVDDVMDTYTIRAPTSLIEELDGFAKNRRVARSHLIRMAIRMFLKQVASSDEEQMLDAFELYGD